MPKPRVGYETVADYYRQKAKLLKDSTLKSHHTLVKTLDPFDNPFKSGIKVNDTIITLHHEKDKLLNYAVQISDTGEIDDVIMEIKINKDKLISRINICDPRLFRFVKYKDLF